MYCYIFGAMPVENFPFKINIDDLVIAADLGVANTNKFNIIPDYIIGDFDSLGYVPKEDNTIIYPIEKDDTDTLLAVKLALKKGYKSFRIFGCIGGRLDHTIANIQTASYIAENNGNSVFFGDKENFSVFKNNNISFDEACTGNISVFALEKSNEVKINNLFYELDNGQLTPNIPLGVSNKFINKNSVISVENGKLLVIWENKSGNYKLGEI